MIENVLSIIKALTMGAMVEVKWQFNTIKRKIMKGIRK